MPGRRRVRPAGKQPGRPPLCMLPLMMRLAFFVIVLGLLSTACGEDVAESTTTPTTAPVIGSSTVATTTPQVTPPPTPPSETSTTESTGVPETTTTTTAPGVTLLEVVVVAGEVADLRAALDDEVRLTFYSEQVNEVHLHTYDLHADVGPDKPAVIEFVASIPGIIEIEFEQGGTLIAELRVDP